VADQLLGWLKRWCANIGTVKEVGPDIYAKQKQNKGNAILSINHHRRKSELQKQRSPPSYTASHPTTTRHQKMVRKDEDGQGYNQGSPPSSSAMLPAQKSKQ
jgi:hypothetical protein